MPQSLLIAVRFHEGRYHGREDGFSGSDGWPPSPARLFQALVAGAAEGGQLRSEDQRALKWLEQLNPPQIVAPAVKLGRAVKFFVPNNDLDSVGGDPARVSEIRVGKHWRPCFFNVEEPVLYAWDFESGEEEALRICFIAERLYQLGRAIDMAWADGKILSQDKAQKILESHPGTLRKPQGAGVAAVPHSGTLDSLILRNQRKRDRLTTVLAGRRSRQLFSQPPKASFGRRGYNTPPKRLCFELRTSSGAFAPHRLASVASLISGLRDAAADRLCGALPEKKMCFERLIIGRGAGPADLDQRIRLMPMPSIGAMHADLSIRRVLLEVPNNCPIRLDDLRWAFAGIQPIDPDTGEILPGNLVSTDDLRMADRFTRRGQLFRSITPLALPCAYRRQLVSSARKKGEDRAKEERKAAGAVVQALRHAGIRAQPADIMVKKEPFHRNGIRAEEFAHGSRFSQHALWHAELRFPEPVTGPLMVGDGRFLGLGLFEVLPQHIDVFAFNLGNVGSKAREESSSLIMHFRRALMSLARDDLGHVGPLFSGHESDGTPARSSLHKHVFLAADDADADGRIDRLIVASPWVCDRRVRAGRQSQFLFQKVVYSLKELNAGRLGRFGGLAAEPIHDGDPLVGPSCAWIGRTPYLATRNLKKNDDPSSVVKADVAAECVRRGLPTPKEIEVLTVTAGPRGGRPAANLKLQFSVAVRGPLLLGRDSHSGGGLFHAMP